MGAALSMTGIGCIKVSVLVYQYRWSRNQSVQLGAKHKRLCDAQDTFWSAQSSTSAYHTPLGCVPRPSYTYVTVVSPNK